MRQITPLSTRPRRITNTVEDPAQIMPALAGCPPGTATDTATQTATLHPSHQTDTQNPASLTYLYARQITQPSKDSSSVQSP